MLYERHCTGGWHWRGKAWSFAFYFGGLLDVVEQGDWGTRRFMYAVVHTVN